MGLFSVLTIVFITLKLTAVIDWSWWLVLAPFYGAVIFDLVILGIYVMIKSNKQPRKPRW